MEIFNIGIAEFIFILLIMLIFLGPEGMNKSARSLARMIRSVVHSRWWRDIVRAQAEAQELPTRLAREAGFDEIEAELRDINQQVRRDVNQMRSQKILPPNHPASKAIPANPAQEVFGDDEPGEDYNYLEEVEAGRNEYNHSGSMDELQIDEATRSQGLTSPTGTLED